LQRTQEAIEEFDYFHQIRPEHPLIVSAWDEKAFLEWSVQGDYEAGIKTLLDSLRPIHPRPARQTF